MGIRQLFSPWLVLSRNEGKDPHEKNDNKDPDSGLCRCFADFLILTFLLHYSSRFKHPVAKFGIKILGTYCLFAKMGPPVNKYPEHQIEHAKESHPWIFSGKTTQE